MGGGGAGITVWAVTFSFCDHRGPPGAPSSQEMTMCPDTGHFTRNNFDQEASLELCVMSRNLLVRP